jgi:hypothetical protein
MQPILAQRLRQSRKRLGVRRFCRFCGAFWRSKDPIQALEKRRRTGALQNLAASHAFARQFKSHLDRGRMKVVSRGYWSVSTD